MGEAARLSGVLGKGRQVEFLSHPGSGSSGGGGEQGRGFPGQVIAARFAFSARTCPASIFGSVRDRLRLCRGPSRKF